MKDIIRLAKERNCDCILFAGDFFHVKKIDAEVIDVAVRSLVSANIPIIGTVGNHDMASYNHQTHSARAVAGKIIFLDSFNGNSFKLGNDIIYGIPYHTNLTEIKHALEKVPKNTKILLMHQGIVGAWLGEGFDGDTEDSIDPALVYDKAELVIIGHFHTPQIIKNGDTHKVTSAGETDYDKYKTVLVPGAVEQHQWGDKGQDRGTWFIDTDKASLEFLPLSSPRFIEANKDTPQSELKDNYVNWVGEKKDIPIGTISESFTVAVAKPEMAASCHSFHLNQNDSVDKVLTTYIQNSPMVGLNNDRLFKEGKRLIG
jgi:DNA repair exonuclease SbcCD nuclease subunit